MIGRKSPYEIAPKTLVALRGIGIDILPIESMDQVLAKVIDRIGTLEGVNRSLTTRIKKLETKISLLEKMTRGVAEEVAAPE